MMLLSRFVKLLIALPRTAKRVVVLGVDASLCVLTVWLAFGLRLDQWQLFAPSHWLPTVVSLGFALPLFVVFGLYLAIFRYAGSAALMAVVRAMLLYGALFSLVFAVMSVSGVPRAIGIIQPVLLLFGVGASRIAARYFLGANQRRFRRHSLPRILIYGAGAAGRQVAAALSNGGEMVAVGFIDDDKTLQGNTINGLPVFDPKKLQAVINKWDVTDVLLAIPSVTRAQRNEVIAALQPFSLRVRTLPGLMDLAYGRVQAADIRDLDVEDLLGRDPVAPNHTLLNKNILNKVVLVTGAGGSIGSELCRQIIQLSPATLLLVEQNEFALYSIHQDLLARFGDEIKVKVVALLASVRDFERMSEIMATWHPHTVYHAAAYKHVPLVEHNPAEGIKNNVMGTLTAARAALENHVDDFVLISTDKAVRPTNIMGASKRLAEMILQAMAQDQFSPSDIDAIPARHPTRFSMVRFGNVLGSSGSVVPKFRQQIKEGGPITLTHADITRYFMTIPEAAQLVIQAGAMACGGDVFVLDMGEPVRILELAHRMVELSGLSIKDDAHPNGDIEIVVTGLRPGEKLYEELLIGGNPESTAHPRIMKAHEDYLSWAELKTKLNALSIALDLNDVATLRAMLVDLALGYQPSGEVVDWIHLEQLAEEVPV